MKTYLSFVLMLALASIAQPALAATPSVHFPFDEGKGKTSKDTVSGKEAVISDTAGWISGKSGNAVGLEGKAGQSVVLGENVLPTGIEGSISLWAKVNGRSDHSYLLSARNPSDDKAYWTLSSDLEGRLLVRYRTGSGATEQRNETSAILDKNTWYHIVLTANSQKYTVYVNGVEVPTSVQNIGKWPADLLGQNLRVSVGSLDASDRTGVLDGFVDDVRIYSGVLSMEEVQKIYNETNEAGPSIPDGAKAGLTLSVSDAVVDYGGSVKVSWNATNAVSCLSSWASSVGNAGEKVYTKIAEPFTVSVTCLSTKGVSDMQSFMVNVGAKPTVIQPGGGTVSADHAKKIAEIEKQIQELTKIVAQLVEELKKILAAKAQ